MFFYLTGEAAIGSIDDVVRAKHHTASPWC